jgi:hypothetical protein
MAKNFSNSISQAAKGGALSSLIPTTETTVNEETEEKQEAISNRGRKPRPDKDNRSASSAERGTKPGEMRKTYLVSIDLADDLEAIAYWERETIKDVINRALSNYVKEYALDSNNKTHVLPSLRIRPIPSKK